MGTAGDHSPRGPQRLCPPREQQEPPSPAVPEHLGGCKHRELSASSCRHGEGFGRVGVKERDAGREVNGFAQEEELGREISETSGLGREGCSELLRVSAYINTCASTRETTNNIHPKNYPGSGSRDYRLGYRAVGKCDFMPAEPVGS